MMRVFFARIYDIFQNLIQLIHLCSFSSLIGHKIYALFVAKVIVECVCFYSTTKDQKIIYLMPPTKITHLGGTSLRA